MCAEIWPKLGAPPGKSSPLACRRPSTLAGRHLQWPDAKVGQEPPKRTTRGERENKTSAPNPYLWAELAARQWAELAGSPLSLIQFRVRRLWAIFLELELARSGASSSRSARRAPPALPASWAPGELGGAWRRLSALACPPRSPGALNALTFGASLARGGASGRDGRRSPGCRSGGGARLGEAKLGGTRGRGRLVERGSSIPSKSCWN